MATNTIQEQLERFKTQEPCFQSASATAFWQDGQGILFFPGTHQAGAISQASGQALLQACQSLQAKPLKRLTLVINSAGAHFEEPLVGLSLIHQFLELLWALRGQGTQLRVLCPGWLYGGMTLSLLTCAHELYLGPEATLGIVGKRATPELERQKPDSLPDLRGTAIHQLATTEALWTLL